MSFKDYSMLSAMTLLDSYTYYGLATAVLHGTVSRLYHCQDTVTNWYKTAN